MLIVDVGDALPKLIEARLIEEFEDATILRTHLSRVADWANPRFQLLIYVM